MSKIVEGIKTHKKTIGKIVGVVVGVIVSIAAGKALMAKYGSDEEIEEDFEPETEE